MRISLVLIFLFLFVFSGAAIATETKQTQGEHANWLVKSLTAHLQEIREIKESKENKAKAQITSDGQYTKGPNRETKFVLAPGESFQGTPDHHSSSTLTMVTIDSKGLKLNYEMRFDHRSFGKDLITVDNGNIVLPLKTAQPKTAQQGK